MPLRRSVRPTASHNPNPARNRDHRRASAATTAAAKAATPKQGSALRALPANAISIAAQAARRRHHQPTPPAPERSHSRRPEDLAASGRSNSASRRPDAPRLALPHRTRMPPLQSPASARRSTGDAARDQPIPRRLPSHCLLHRCKHRCLHHCPSTPHHADRRKAAVAGWVRYTASCPHRSHLLPGADARRFRAPARVERCGENLPPRIPKRKIACRSRYISIGLLALPTRYMRGRGRAGYAPRITHTKAAGEPNALTIV